MKRPLAALLLATLLAGCAPPPPPSSGDELTQSEASSVASSETASVPEPSTKSGMPSGTAAELITVEEAMQEKPFGSTVSYVATTPEFAPSAAAAFSSDDIKNLPDLEKAYGFALSTKEKVFLKEHKFLLKNLLSTSIRPTSDGDNDRELVALFRTVAGTTDFRSRSQANAVFYSSDVFMHLYPLVLTELMKEMENTEFAPAMERVSKEFFTQASAKVDAATDAQTKKEWTSVRNYFAVPYAILSNVQAPLGAEDYYDQATGAPLDRTAVTADFAAKDKTVDTYEATQAFVKELKLDSSSEAAVLGDLKSIYAAEANGTPVILKPEYDEYTQATSIQFAVDWTQFTPRSHYTSSSLRRQYFRAMTWFIQVPFFLKSPTLTAEAFKIAGLFADNQQALSDYARLEAAIRFIVGPSDDLMPVDYLAALASAKDASKQEEALMEYLVKARSPKIKNISATYPFPGGVQTNDVILLTKGMRFFSGKFIIDSSWTQRLTQGDEAPRPGYPAKLPPMASSLEVMALLGSDYARSKIPTLDFAKGDAGKAIDRAMEELAKEKEALTDADWQKNLYAASLWSIQGLFGWLKEHRKELPQFIQSPLWDVKTLMTASGLWTEMRHATLLYAKQSFAELGGGGGACDRRKIPPAAMGFVEPNVQLYDRLLYLAKRTQAGLSEQEFKLSNSAALEAYIAVLQRARDYSVRELKDTPLAEKIVDNEWPDYRNPATDTPEKCVQQEFDGVSEPEQLRLFVNDLARALPVPVEGPILPAKDRRMALLADVHTGGDSANPTKVLYEGIGVPLVIIVLVKDVNGPRATIGFTYAHYEFTELYGDKRLTDEDWQKNFYEPADDPYAAYNYTDKATWPAAPSWYDSILRVQ